MYKNTGCILLPNEHAPTSRQIVERHLTSIVYKLAFFSEISSRTGLPRIAVSRFGHSTAAVGESTAIGRQSANEKPSSGLLSASVTCTLTSPFVLSTLSAS